MTINFSPRSSKLLNSSKLAQPGDIKTISPGLAILWADATAWLRLLFLLSLTASPIAVAISPPASPNDTMCFTWRLVCGRSSRKSESLFLPPSRSTIGLSKLLIAAITEEIFVAFESFIYVTSFSFLMNWSLCFIPVSYTHLTLPTKA